MALPSKLRSDSSGSEIAIPPERLVAVAEGAIFGIRKQGAASAAKHRHAVGVAHRQGAKIDGVKQAEDGGVHADAERQAEERQEGEGGRFAQETNGEREVVHEGKTPRGGRLFR